MSGRESLSSLSVMSAGDGSNTAAAAGSSSRCGARLGPLREAWDCEYPNVEYDDDGNPGWRCNWCKKFKKVVNATKALAHVLGVPGQSIAACSAKIDPVYFQRYQDLYSRKNSRKTKRQKNLQNYANHVTEEVEIAASKLAEKQSFASPFTGGKRDAPNDGKW